MSARCTAAVFQRYQGRGTEYVLAIYLATVANHEGARIFASVNGMARATRACVPGVRRALAVMRASGWLQVVGPARPANAVEYLISPQWLEGSEQ